MNILHVIPSLTWERGGPTTVVRALAHHQTRAGHRVAVLTTDQGARRGERPAPLPPDVEVQRLAVQGPDRFAYAPGFAAALGTQLRTAEVVHIHTIFTYPVHIALRVALAARVPAVLRPCGILHRYGLQRSRLKKAVYLTWWGRMVRRACSAWHFTSTNESEQSWPWDNSPRFIVPNGIDPAEYVTDPAEVQGYRRRCLPELGDSPYVLFLGRLHPKKRLDLLLEAFLAAAPADFKLVVAGPDEALLWNDLANRFLREPRAANRVVRQDTVMGREKALLLAGAHLFALSSEHENFGVAALEALAAGTPVLLSPHVDLAEEAVAAGVGYEAPLTREAWAGKIGSLLTDPISLRAAGDRARQWATAHYAWERLSEQITNRYRELQNGRPLAMESLAGSTS